VILNPVELVVLQGTSLCNLNCTYCDLSSESRRTKLSMDPALIERVFTQLFQSGRTAPEVTVLWHSGEPLTLPHSYYDDAIARILEIKAAFAGEAISIKFGIQTNGVLIDDEWCQFFTRHADRLEIGVSCDGPNDLHDAFRVNWSNRDTHRQTVRGMDLLHQHGIKYKLIAVVTRHTLRQPERFLQFFVDRRDHLSGFHFNILAEATSSNRNLSYSALDRDEFYAFYRRLLALSRGSPDGRPPFEILNFTQATARILASKDRPGSSYFEQATAPLRSLNVDARGNITTFYAGLSVDTLSGLYGDGVGLSLGNIFETSLDDMVTSEKLQRMLHDFARSKWACETSCEYFSVCPGGFDLLKRKSLGSFDATETAECLIHVKTLVDAVLDDMSDHVRQLSTSSGVPADDRAIR
jgi:uncharacterized protein